MAVLEVLGDGEEHSREDIMDRVAQRFGLTAEELAMTKPGPRGPQNRWGNDIDHVISRPKGEFVKAGDGIYQITDLGRTKLGQEPSATSRGAPRAPDAAPPVRDAVAEDIGRDSSDIYASYGSQGLYFPDEVVTSLALSLATKRFVILTGISGTGKTRIALGLARYLEADDEEPIETEPPQADANNAYIRVTAPKLSGGRSTLDSSTRRIIDGRLGLPDRGSSKLFTARLPDGSVGRLRINNVGFEEPTRQLWLLFFRKDTLDWLRAHAKPGDFLHLDLNDQDAVDLALKVVQGTPAEATPSFRRHAVVAIRSDWTDPRGLVGFFNPLTRSYNRTSVVDLLLRAGEDPDHPYIVLLDEMNLARVEYYFSDFLSSLESGHPIQLMSPGEEEEMLASGSDDVPAQLDIPSNVSFVGTVNVDETTHAFSPKVLDRANVIEFSDVDVGRAIGRTATRSRGGLRLRQGRLLGAWLCTSREQALESAAVAYEVESFTAMLRDVHDVLVRFHLHFGYRVITEVSAYVGHALQKCGGERDEIVRRAFDLQLQQKILPKLSGGRELEEPLTLLLEYCLTATKPQTVDVDAVRIDARRRLDRSIAGDANATRFPGSAGKLLRMLDRLANTGFVGALE